MKPVHDPPDGTVHIVDDDLSFLRALSRLLRAAGYHVRAYSSAESFLAEEPDTVPACVVVDLHMPSMNGLDLQKALRRTGREMEIVFLSGRGDIPSTVRAIRDGAHDFLEKNTPKGKLLSTIAEALRVAGRRFEERSEHSALRARFSRLSTREMEVLRQVVRGKLNKQIASDLGIAERTVKLHRTAITRKLGVPSVAELTRLVHLLDTFAGTCP